MSLIVPERSGASGDGSGGWSTALAAAPVIPPGGRSGGGRPGRWRGGCVPPELEQVVGAAQQLPLGLAGAQAAAQEPAGALLLLDGRRPARRSPGVWRSGPCRARSWAGPHQSSALPRRPTAGPGSSSPATPNSGSPAPSPTICAGPGSGRRAGTAHPRPGPARVPEPAREDDPASRCTKTPQARPRTPTRLEEPPPGTPLRRRKDRQERPHAPSQAATNGVALAACATAHPWRRTRSTSRRRP
jgi:hypothetical protein